MCVIPSAQANHRERAEVESDAKTKEDLDEWHGNRIESTST